MRWLSHTCTHPCCPFQMQMAAGDGWRWCQPRQAEDLQRRDAMWLLVVSAIKAWGSLSTACPAAVDHAQLGCPGLPTLATAATHGVVCLLLPMRPRSCRPTCLCSQTCRFSLLPVCGESLPVATGTCGSDRRIVLHACIASYTLFDSLSGFHGQLSDALSPDGS